MLELDRNLAEKDKELRLTKTLMRESFQRQVEELDKLKRDFELYDSEVVEYLEKVFSGKVFPKGAHEGQDAREQAEVTALAARNAATPLRIPDLDVDTFIHHTTSDPYMKQELGDRSPTKAWLGSNLQPLSQRLMYGF